MVVMASGSDDETILLWDQNRRAGRPAAARTSAGGDGAGLQFRQSVLLSGSDDQTVRLWDAGRRGGCTYFWGQKTVRAVALVGKLAAAGDWDGHLLCGMFRRENRRASRSMGMVFR